jgi:hypothetical protein
MMKKLVNLLPVISLAVAMLASHPAVAAANPVTVFATIDGGGTALMTSPPGAQPGFKNVSSFGIHATLYSDGTASGHIDCVDQQGDAFKGNIFGDVTSWWQDGNGLNLYISNAQLVSGGNVDLGFTIVTIQNFGGAGVGHWTLGKHPATPFCVELLLSGQLVERLN